eukprot:Pompholyxophrys_punicea_v1_NODE_765_length_1323_cov_14.661672.p2 type:complete len:109 gc:universal NODE_765_length_1323_cov_14.661672:137-463(+)
MIIFLLDQICYLSMPFEEWKTYHCTGLFRTIDDNNDHELMSRLTAHLYDAAIFDVKQTRALGDLTLLDCFPHPLKSLRDYRDAYLKIFREFDSFTLFFACWNVDCCCS